jgi:hypothetical protein
MRTERIIQRQTLKTKLATLEERVKAARPLVEAEAQLKRAYFAGYKKRLSEEIEEEKAKNAQPQDFVPPVTESTEFTRPANADDVANGIKSVPTDEHEQIKDMLIAKHPELLTLAQEQELLSKQPFEPSNQAEDDGGTQPDQQTPIGTV